MVNTVLLLLIITLSSFLNIFIPPLSLFLSLSFLFLFLCKSGKVPREVKLLF